MRKLLNCSARLGHLAWVLVIGFSTAGSGVAQAQPTIVSTVPANFATGVSPSAAVVFTFSQAMDASLTSAQFFDSTTATFFGTTPVWSAGNTVLTCTPVTPFTANKQITWFVSGEDMTGTELTGNTAGFFTTGNGGGGGAGTNATTSFNLGKTYIYNQSSAGVPTLDSDTPYFFTATTGLASNRTATAVTLALPTSATSNLLQNFLHPESFTLVSFTTNLASFDALFPAGNYQFKVSAAASNQQVTLNLAAPSSQPNAPHVTDYVAAQAVNPSQSFTLTWDPFTGAAAADYVYVAVGNNLFATPSPGTIGALSGTATSVQIPAGTLQSGTNYTASVGFYRATWTSNATYVTGSFRASVTEFSLVTTGSGSRPTLANATVTAGKFNFDVISSSSLALTVEYSTNLLATNWQTLLTTNTAAGTLHLLDSRPATNKSIFYRVRAN
ncbi:MAG: hypothetical protein JWR69_3428 [Pedosphaera sp.]|nr:hypothetical protein [Pedosphaera sp.]